MATSRKYQYKHFLIDNKIRKSHTFLDIGFENFKITLQQHDGEFAADRNKGSWEGYNHQI